MLLNILGQFNWVDIVVVILLFRIGYIAIKSGLSVEIFKLLGTILAIYTSLHYYTIASDFIRGFISNKEIPLEFLDFLCFLVLAIFTYLVFVLLRSILYRFLRMEAAPRLNKWGGLVLGLIRGFLVIGLIVFLLVISSIGYLKNSVGNSYLGKRFFKVAPATYSWLWDSIMSKFMGGEKLNKTVLEVEDAFTQK
jgi:uncharacterized membrane protein required for colicin V production